MRARSSLGVLAALLGACGSDALPPPASAAGIEVFNQTTGDPIELDGYTVSVDDSPARPLQVNQSVAFPDLEPGDHSVALGGVERDCRVLGENPRTVHAAGGTASSLFLVTCNASNAGRVVVQTYTSGDDSARYTVTLDGGRFAELGAKDTVTFTAVPAGQVTVTLGGATAGCTVLEPNPRTLQLRVGEQFYTRFKIYCTP